MTHSELEDKACAFLDKFCRQVTTRQVGSAGNREATDFFQSVISSFGFKTSVQPFDCIDMRTGEIRLSAGEQPFTAYISPYSLGCQVRAELVAASTMQELETLEAAGKLLLLRGELTREQLMPKNFVFYNPESHQRLYQLLESKQPAAIIAATDRNPEQVGALYPFPLFEDGDFDIPSAFMTDEEGKKLSNYVGREAELFMDAERIPAQAENVLACKHGQVDKKVVICAHIDARLGTPGALDNASGCSVLLLLAELLAAEKPRATIEIVAFNGEDYYSAGGQMAYLAAQTDLSNTVDLAINLDDLGYIGHATGFSFYNCSDSIIELTRSVIACYPNISEMPQWYQGDHMIFVSNQVPALALTSTGFEELMMHITHTPKDIPQVVDLQLLIEAALALRDLVLML